MNQTIWLPFRKSDSSEAVLVGYLSLRNQHLVKDGLRPVAPMAERFTYIDLGHGVPDRAVDPEACWP
jgi:hypothetical protein